MNKIEGKIQCLIVRVCTKAVAMQVHSMTEASQQIFFFNCILKKKLFLKQTTKKYPF